MKAEDRETAEVLREVKDEDNSEKDVKSGGGSFSSVALKIGR